MPRIAVSYCVHDDHAYLTQSIASVREAGEVFVFVSRIPWHGEAGDWETAAQIARDAGAEVVLGDWSDELSHRLAVHEYLRERDYTHALVVDGDEIIEPELLSTLLTIAQNELADRVYVHWDTYWKSPEYVIRPRERFTPLLLFDLRHARPVGLREFEGGRALLLGPEYGLVHHLSYVGPDERIWRKITTWGHRTEVVPGWWEHVWLQWDSDKQLSHLHPTHPPSYGFAERIAVPDILLSTLARYRELSGTPEPDPAAWARPASWPRVSVILPLHGGREDLHACLNSLERCGDLLHEVLVIDNASPDDAAEEAESRADVRLLRNDSNLGFAAACNQGASEATCDVLLFLNSDTIVPRAGLIRLVEALTRSGSIAGSGPFSNQVGHFQKITPTYTTLENLDRFAQDFACRSVEDIETDMLVGFCLAVRRSVWEEIGGFDEQFGLGTFEDNDLCYRMRRAGFRLVIAARSFVHHEGSKTLRRLPHDVGALLRRNEALFRQKWRDDLESGYASHLSGLAAERIHFEADHHPDVRARTVADLARRADISLCMIVKNEERVLRECLLSAKPFFREMIVVDTGSTDRTKEIALECGAQVYDFPWVDSFSAARNESLKYARGKWIFWMDADDTLPWRCGEALLHATLNAPRDVIGFIVPVQFVERDGTADRTRVDHVKLFRNRPGVRFEHRIHEQILPSLNALGGKIARSEAYVLHSGYDTSPEGQARKRERDFKLLHLDLEDHPDHPFVLFNFGMTYHYIQEHEEAVCWLRKCLAVSQPNESIVRKAYALLAGSLWALDCKEEAIDTLRKGLATVPGDTELHFQAGRMLTEVGRYKEAKEHYEKTLASNPTEHYSSLDVSILDYKTYFNLGQVCFLMADYTEAKRWWQQTMETAPEHLPSAFALFDAALEARDHVAARHALSHVETIQGHRESWTAMGIRYAEAIGGPENGDLFLRQALAAEPDNLSLRLSLARRLLQQEREQEARQHLLLLEQADVAEAAYFLGIFAIRNDDYPQALAYIERAHALNPNHPETTEQWHNLRRALGLAEPTGEALPFEDAVRQVAANLGLDADTLLAYAEEDTIGGYTIEPPSSLPPQTLWPGGSVWTDEGRLLYALVRALQPEVIVEVGSLVGCSTSHLAAACAQNGKGKVYAVDPYLDFTHVSPDLLPHIVPIPEDVFTWTPPERVDFLFEDGSHAPGFTRNVLHRLLPALAPGALSLCHDFHNGILGAHIAAEFTEVFGDNAPSVRIAPSDCGLGYACYTPKTTASNGKKPTTKASLTAKRKKSLRR